MQWSDVKQQVFRFESDIVVSAGAGSGKTAALVELYLRLLAGETSVARPLAAEEIVAITFTDKAAVEMKERVRREIRKRLAAGDLSADWERQLQSLSASPIATFHAFCARLLRENPAEAGVDPAFTLLDELAAGAELREALDEVLETELEARSPALRLLLRHFPLSGMGRGKGVREHLRDLQRWQAGSGREYAELAARSEEWTAEAGRRFATGVAELAGLVTEAERILAGKPLVFHGALQRLPALYRQGKLDLENPATPDLLSALQGCISGGWGKEKPVRDQLTARLEELQLAWWQRRSAPLVEALLALASRLAAAYGQRKERRGALDFEDLQLKARDLLAGDPRLRADCRQRFAVVMVDEFQDTNPLQKELVSLLCGPGQRLFIVGDPKQSIYRFRGADVTVFAQAQAETAAAGGETLYFQESFRSRQGIIDFVNSLFSQVFNPPQSPLIKAGGKGGSEFEVGYGPGDHLEPERRDWDGAPCVELMIIGAGVGAGEQRVLEAAAVAAKIRRLVDGAEGVRVYDRKTGTGDSGFGTRDGNLEPAFVPRKPRYGDIAILFRRFSNLKLFERELRKAAIPYYVVKGRGFYRCQEVLDILNFLRYLEYGGDLAPLAGVLRSPLCGVSDETLYLLSRLAGGIGSWEKWVARSPVPSPQSPLLDRIDPEDRERLASLARLLARLRPLRDRLALAELLEEVLTGTDFASSLLTTFQGTQKVANLRKLIEISRTFTEPGDSSLRRFVNYLAELVATEPTEAEAVIFAEGENVVRLMTIHQSKGLEFPVVIVPELGAGQPPDHAAVKFDERLGMGVKLAFPGSPSQATLAFQAITALRSRKETAELKRLFYVAATRARDYLLLSGEPARNGGQWREWLDTFRSGPDAHLLKVMEAADGQLPAPPELLPAAKSDAGWDPVVIAAACARSLRYEPPPPAEMVFSPTALEDYRHCPRKYFYKAIMGLDEGLFADLLGPPGRRGKTDRQGMTALDKGNLAHALLEQLDFAADVGGQRAACMQRAARIAADPAHPGVAEVIDSVLALAATPLGRGLAGKRLLREHPFTLVCRGAATYYIRGAMDLVAVEDERVTVYDYKYLNREGADLEGYRFQIRAYLLALSRAFPGRVLAGELLFLRGGGAERVTCDPRDFEEELLAIMDAIRARSCEEEFLLRPGCDGSHCPFRQRCRKPAPGDHP